MFRTIVNDSTHCVLFFCTRLDLFRTIETIFVRNRSIRVFLCFRGVQLEAHSTFFTTKNESKFVLCATGCTPRMGLFCTIETFFIPAGTKKVSLVRNPLESFESSEKNWAGRFENNRCKRGHARGACRGGRQHASGDVRCARPRDKATVISNPASPRPAGAFRVATCQQGVPFASRPVNRARCLSQCTSPLARWRPH